MKPRPDGLPEGHPEKGPVPIASLTIYSASTDPMDPGFNVYGDMRILVPVSQDNAAETLEVVRNIMGKILRSDNVTTAVMHRPGCGCDGHEGGDQE